MSTKQRQDTTPQGEGGLFLSHAEALILDAANAPLDVEERVMQQAQLFALLGIGRQLERIADALEGRGSCGLNVNVWDMGRP